MRTTTESAVYSTLGSDPDLGELVEMFVEEMPDRIAVFEAALAGGDLESLRRSAHQLKGAGGSYGFDQLTPLAEAAEFAARDGEPEEVIQRTVLELLNVCRRLRAGQPA